MELVREIEQIIHISKTFTESELLSRHKTVDIEVSHSPFQWLPRWSVDRACAEGMCEQENNLGCYRQWLMVRLNQCNTCIQVAYGEWNDPDDDWDSRLLGIPSGRDSCLLGWE
jgi:hypothetical protein